MSPEGLGTDNRAYPRGWPFNWLNDVVAYKFFYFCSIFSFNPNGEALNFWAMGWTDSSAWSLAWKSLSFPTPKSPHILSASSPHWQSLSRFSILQFIGLSAECLPCLLFLNNETCDTLSIFITQFSFKLTGSGAWLLRAIRVQFPVWFPWLTLDFFSFEHLPRLPVNDIASGMSGT